MRNLTIKRAKRFVACLGTMKVYIEDVTANDLTINGVTCRKLGTLKNGEEKTFEISEESAKVFVIADKLSKGYCNEYYELPSGTEDIVLTGKNEFNPASGNAFRFDGVTDEKVLANRKKGKEKGIIVLAIALAVGFVLGTIIGVGSIIINVFGSLTKDKTFAHDGMSITLTGSFRETDYNGFDICYDSSKVAVFVIKDSFSVMDGLEDYTLREYGEAVIEGNGFSSLLESSDGLTYFEYMGTSDQAYNYYAFVFKSDDAFWLIQFATPESEAAKYEAKIFEWAKTIKFD
ncbi:MAG: hypothetical protein IJ021_06485, partial [Clostridia bacterium]|nr:hypothetical protein [Clostridia bacterium]